MNWLAAGLSIAFALVAVTAAKDVRNTLHRIADVLDKHRDSDP